MNEIFCLSHKYIYDAHFGKQVHEIFAGFVAKVTNVITSKKIIVWFLRCNKDLGVRLGTKLVVSFNYCAVSYDIYVMAC